MSDETAATFPVPPMRTPMTAPSQDSGKFARLYVQRSKLRDAVKSITTERDAARAELVKLQTENQELKIRADNSASSKQLQELQAKLRTIQHRKVFDRVALEKGARAEGLDDLWRLSEYEAEGDEASVDFIDGLIAEQKSARSYLFENAEAAAQAANSTLATTVPGPAKGQGGKVVGVTPSGRYTKAQLRDPNFCFENNAAIKASQDNGTFEVVD